MFELREYESDFDEDAGPFGADGDALQRFPALAQQGESAFAEGAHTAEQGIVGAVVDIETFAWRLFHGGADYAHSIAEITSVNYHLRKIYRRFNVGSRLELLSALRQ